MLLVDFCLDEAIDDGALADSAVPEEDYFVLEGSEAAAEIGLMHYIIIAS